MFVRERQNLKKSSGRFFIVVLLSAGFSLSGCATEIREEKAGQPETTYYARRMIDQTVANDRGEELGKAHDLIIALNGEVTVMILSVSGISTIGHRQVAVPLGSVKIHKEKIIYPVPKERLPLPDAAYENPYDLPWEWDLVPRWTQVKFILDEVVLNYRDEEIGEIDDLLIAPEGKIDSVVLSVDKDGDTGEKLVSLPFEGLRILHLSASLWVPFLLLPARMQT